jgi:hypothetical protein
MIAVILSAAPAFSASFDKVIESSPLPIYEETELTVTTFESVFSPFPPNRLAGPERRQAERGMQKMFAHEPFTLTLLPLPSFDASKEEPEDEGAVLSRLFTPERSDILPAQRKNRDAVVATLRKNDQPFPGVCLYKIFVCAIGLLTFVAVFFVSCASAADACSPKREIALVEPLLVKMQAETRDPGPQCKSRKSDVIVVTV